ncbi:hypothetical protein ASE07_00430 [Noviherbaspirillum sp. Root189]|nr:hypothetical protein ASE07_00430 [Noviherbaspirillum sp. Root189]
MPVNPLCTELIMILYRHLLLAGAALALIAGCQKTPEPKTSAITGPSTAANTSTNASANTSANTGAAENPGKSVALPPNQMPASDAAIPPKVANAPNSGDANTPTQANPAALSKGQEQNSLPHSGQVNNHSTPDTTGPASSVGEKK